MAVIAFAGFGWITYSFISSYLESSGDRWTRFLFAFRYSYTILWARFTMAVGFATAFLVNAADYFNLPGVSDVLQQYMTPTTVSMVGVAIMIVTEIARRRSL